MMILLRLSRERDEGPPLKPKPRAQLAHAFRRHCLQVYMVMMCPLYHPGKFIEKVETAIMIRFSGVLKIRKKGEGCIKKLTKSTDLFEQWSQICSSRDLFYQIYLCTDILEGGPGGEEEQIFIQTSKVIRISPYFVGEAYLGLTKRSTLTNNN
ncbi:hypothetical protein TNCV_4956981 [Trichonephila clavipes]|nr:hypothetical protein TNCV_4956981 [Trichonephila clavipes]